MFYGCAFAQNISEPDSDEVQVEKPLHTDIGVYYFPGWHSKSAFWEDIRGTINSRSPNVPWHDRVPLLGYYAEEDVRVTEQHIEWANQFEITFFAYDWYWDGRSTRLNHAIDNFLKASNNSKLKFSLLWANHNGIPGDLRQFDSMIEFWLKTYFAHPQFYFLEGKPVVFIFSRKRLEADAKKFGWTVKGLLARANERAKKEGYAGIFFVLTNDVRPSDNLEASLADQGFSAYTGWCNLGGRDSHGVADYQVMVDAYLKYYDAAAQTKGRLFYLPPVSPGRDSRPWHGGKAQVRTNPTPMKFKMMLKGAKELIDSQKKGVLPLVMIQSWNEFGEGAFIEPSKKFGFEYLNVTQEILGN